MLASRTEPLTQAPSGKTARGLSIGLVRRFCQLLDDGMMEMLSRSGIKRPRQEIGSLTNLGEVLIKMEARENQWGV